MATIGRIRPAHWALMLAVVTAGGLAGCNRDEPKTTSAATGTAATVSADPSSTAPPTTACTFSGATDPAQGGGDAPTRLLTAVRVGSHGCCERVTFEFK